MAVTATGRRIRKRKLKAEINVVPYIDVMLVLLIIFMVTTPLLNLGTDIKLPDSKAMALSTPKEPIVVSIYADGAYALMAQGPDSNKSVTGTQLQDELGAIHRNNPEATVLVRGDRSATYQALMAGIDRINAAGISRISLISQPAGTVQQ
ncbi:ExbD/TolR family protein [Cognatiluteimonas profundi]|uniref:ExbD/TolR family protein n=1 Tax=Cognatiluteimonas profundi TaxID=2594501 RepID=UPI00131DF70B|nr:ExbD/TolR family protein [Lysobacter profundi]